MMAFLGGFSHPISPKGYRIAVALEGIDLTDYPKQTMARHQATILNFYGFRAFKPHGRAVLPPKTAIICGI